MSGIGRERYAVIKAGNGRRARPRALSDFSLSVAAFRALIESAAGRRV